MNNGSITNAFLGAIDKMTKNVILGNIARNYGISPEAAHLEVTGPDAEILLDYVTGPERAATSLMLKRFKIGGN